MSQPCDKKSKLFASGAQRLCTFAPANSTPESSAARRGKTESMSYVADPSNSGGDFDRDTDYISTRITADGRDGYPVEAGRYRLVVARACPWANRTIIVRRLLGLEDALSIGFCGPTHDERSWTFDLDPGGVDPALDFIGHIGGDDFILLMQSNDWTQRCEQVLQAFANSTQMFFGKASHAGGYESEDRQGRLMFHPFPTLSIGAVAIQPGDFSSHYEVSAAAAEAKKMAKRRPGNSLFSEKRSPKAASAAVHAADGQPGVAGAGLERRLRRRGGGQRRGLCAARRHLGAGPALGTGRGADGQLCGGRGLFRAGPLCRAVRIPAGKELRIVSRP